LPKPKAPLPRGERWATHSASATGEAAPSCVALATTYAQLWEAIYARAARGDVAEEVRLRNRAQVLLGRMWARGCRMPRTL